MWTDDLNLPTDGCRISQDSTNHLYFDLVTNAEYPGDIAILLSRRVSFIYACGAVIEDRTPYPYDQIVTGGFAAITQAQAEACGVLIEELCP